MNNEINLNQNNSETLGKTKVTDQEIAAAIAIGLIIAGILYVVWRLATSATNSTLVTEVGESIAKSAMSSVDIASMLKT